ncbi:MAG: metallophosphoesterase [Chloroflexi bacterium]|nr:metallophosphoesterase [Chloroflexota bacterium]
MPFFSKKPSKKATRLFFATDLHGSERTYRKFINAGKFYDVNVIVMGGDIQGKLLIPIIKESNGHYRATLQGRVEHLSTEEELNALRGRLDILGFYHKIMSEDEFRALSADPKSVDELFHELARQKLVSWVDLAEERLNGTGIKCFVTGGNDDDPAVLSAIKREGTKSFFACENEMVQVDDDHTMISVGLSTPTPWKTPREVSEEQLGEMIEKMAAKVPDMNKAIFNFHDPPKDSTLDTCPMLDWTKDPPTQIVQGGQPVMHGAGSKSVRDAIEKYKPMLGLHGHIHESQSVAKIGRTTCINPGSEYAEGILRGCLVTFADGEVQGYQMTSG